MTNQIKFVAPRIPFVNPNDGTLTRDGVLFLQGIFNRIGGAVGVSTSEVLDLIAASQSIEMVAQSTHAPVLMPDIVQPWVGGVEYSDIMQSGSTDQMSETTMQT